MLVRVRPTSLKERDAQVVRKEEKRDGQWRRQKVTRRSYLPFGFLDKCVIAIQKIGITQEET
jgi:hypothetical protein